MPMNDPKEIAADIARELREHPERWTQGYYAFDASGEMREAHDPRATCWCLMGMIDKRTDCPTDTFEAFQKAAPFESMSVWNDAASTYRAGRDRPLREGRQVMLVTDFQVLMHALSVLDERAPQSDRLKIAPQPSRGTPERTSLEPGATGEGGSNALAFTPFRLEPQ
jgi:hypothetical protein